MACQQGVGAWNGGVRRLRELLGLAMKRQRERACDPQRRQARDDHRIDRRASAAPQPLHCRPRRQGTSQQQQYLGLHWRQQGQALRQRQPGDDADHRTTGAEADADLGPEPQAQPAMAAAIARPSSNSSGDPEMKATADSPRPAIDAGWPARRPARAARSARRDHRGADRPGGDLQHRRLVAEPYQHQRPQHAAGEPGRALHRPACLPGRCRARRPTA